MSLITVIVPNYNHAPFLKERLDSIFNQTYQKFEVILLDDCSRDSSVEILKEYAQHPKVSHFIGSQTNSGSPFKQWKRGVDLAKGDWIWIAESDDFCELNFLEEVSAYFSSSDLISVRYKEVNEHSEVLNKQTWAEELTSVDWSKNRSEVWLDEIKCCLSKRNTIPNVSGVVFKKSILTEHVQWSIIEKMKFCGDWMMYLSFPLNMQYTYFAKSLNYFRMHTQSTRSAKDNSTEKMRFNEFYRCLRLAKDVRNESFCKKDIAWVYAALRQRLVGLSAFYYKIRFNRLLS